jgi:hypothetical protein
MRSHLRSHLRQGLAALVLAAGLALPAGAQCVMCYRTAHAQNEARSRVMNLGILLLGAPPFLILAGFVGFVAYKNEKTRED